MMIISPKFFFFVALSLAFLAMAAIAGEEGGTVPTETQEQPLFSFVQITDIHFGTSEEPAGVRPTGDWLVKGLKFVNEKVKPDFVIFTGDIVADITTKGGHPFDRAAELRKVKQIIDDNLDCKWYAVGGNHDWNEYEGVFGEGNYSFDFRGMRFVAIQLKYTNKFTGWGVFRRLKWLRKQLADAGEKPVVVFTHNPINLPTFKNAREVRKTIEDAKNVVLVLQGHLHVELKRESGGVVYYVAPGFLMGKRPFKVFYVYEDRIEHATAQEEDGEHVLGKRTVLMRFPDNLRPRQPKRIAVMAQNVAGHLFRDFALMLRAKYGYDVTAFADEECAKEIASGRATRENFLKALAEKRKELRQGDMLLILLCCHMEKGFLINNTLPYRELNEALAGLDGVTRVVILEGCHTGAGIPEIKNAEVVYASVGGDDKCYGGFLLYLVNALGRDEKSTREADVNKDGRVSLGEAYDFAADVERLKKFYDSLPENIWPKGYCPLPRRAAPDAGYETFLTAD